MYAEVDRWPIGYSAMNSDGGGCDCYTRFELQSM